jgi:hypothetical protein
MANFIASELHYLGLQRVVDVSSREVTWASTIRLGENTNYFGGGNSPDAALADVLDVALAEAQSPILSSTPTLDHLAGDLLQLIVTRSQADAAAGAGWIGEGRFRRQRAFWLIGPLQRPERVHVVGSSPDEVIHELVRQATQER